MTAPVAAGARAWAAPGRVNLIGEHTDYNDGFVLPIALPQRTVATVEPLSGEPLSGEPRWVVTSAGHPDTMVVTVADLRPGGVTGWAAYVAGVIWALREAGVDVPAARLSIESDVPMGAGLSSSAALECAVLSALCDLAGTDLPIAQRPAIAQRAENIYVGVPCGIMDQTASIRCQAGHALFLDCRSGQVEQVPFDPASAGLALLVIDSRTPHQHTENEYAQRRAACEAAAAALGVPALRDVDDLDAALARLDDDVTRRRVRHVVTENERVLSTVEALRAGDWPAVGRLFTASHASMRDDYEITVPTVDLAVEVALRAGALGARMTGGGFGGCVLALVAETAVETVRSAVAEAYAAAGYASPTSFEARASAGAHRLASVP
ncbi:MAG: galactokinase [Micromonosporaceae bacterium]|nr:galactokinase [Micromonosporaceae bacterium]